MNNRVQGTRAPLPAMLAAAIALSLQIGVAAGDTGATAPSPTKTSTTDAVTTVELAQATPPPAAAPAMPAAPRTPEEEDEDEAKELETIVVTYRASLAAALDVKRDAVGQVDAIVAEDIGKFPDLNLAESLQRVPGVSITRDAGEGRQISVRGLDSQFTRVRINGMEALTTTGGTDSSGGTNRARGFDFNVFASELFNNIIVRKTASAELEEGSLGATVDLNVARPFDYDGFTFVTNAQMGYNDLSEDWDPRGAMLISNTFADGTFGALLSIAYTERNLIEEGHSTVRWDNGPSSAGFSATSPFAPARLATTFHPRIPRYGVLGHEQERLGITGSLQFEPNEDTRFVLDALYSDFDANRSENFLEAISFSRTGAGKPQTIVRDGEVDDRGNLVYGVFDNVDIRSESRFDELSTEFTQISLGWEQDFSDRFRMSGMIGRAKSEHDNPIQTTITIDRTDVDGFVWDYRGDDRLPFFDWGVDVSNPASWSFANGLSEIRLRPQTADNTFSTSNLNLEFDFNETFTLKGGLALKDYDFETTERRRASETAVPVLPAGASLADLVQLFRIGDLDLPPGSTETWLIPDFDAFAELFDIYCNCGTFALSDAVASARGNNRSVNESDSGGFLQLDWNTTVADRPLRGNVGMRYVQTEQESIGFAVVNSVPTLTTVERDYDDWLPSLNVAWDLTDDFVLRFGAADVMARPGLGNLTPGVTVSVSGGARTVTGGDPFLEPFRAKTADLGFEWYFAPESVLAAAIFYKDIETFVQTSRETRPYNTSGLPDSLLAGTGASPEDDFQFNIPLNTPGGKLRGIELAYQQPFTFLPPGWDNFGMLLNYTYVDSEIQYLTSTGANSLLTDLTGLSKNAYNATLYYETERWGARVSAAYRAEYLTVVPGRNNNDVEGVKAATTIDFSASWKLNDHVEFTFEGLNLTDEFNDQWVDSVGDRSSVYHHTGRQYFVGVRVKN